MSRTWGIITATVMWCVIIVYVVAAGGYSRQKRSEVTVTDMRISLADSGAVRVISTAMVQRWLAEGQFDMKGKPIGEVNTSAIDKHLRTYPEVRAARAWVNLDGILTVEVAQRRPVMRVRSTNGYRFWLTDDNCIIPDKGEFTAYVPVITGHTPFTFPTNAKGSYDGMLEAAYLDFVGQFTEIENERRALTSQKASLRAQIRDIRQKRAKRFWSDARKEEFNKRKREQIAGLQEQVVKLDESLTSVTARKNALREKEKKSQQSHRFLTKLANFVKSVENDSFWAAQIVQINVLGGGQNGGNAWKEPQIELVPRAGDHIVLLGELDGNESRRLEKLRVFYRNALAREGWDTQRYINIKYDGQIVCTR